MVYYYYTNIQGYDGIYESMCNSDMAENGNMGDHGYLIRT